MDFSNTSGSDNQIDLRAPLHQGWRRETVISQITRKFKVRGEVCYYAPGSQQKLNKIEEIQKVS